MQRDHPRVLQITRRVRQKTFWRQKASEKPREKNRNNDDRNENKSAETKYRGLEHPMHEGDASKRTGKAKKTMQGEKTPEWIILVTRSAHEFCR